MTTDIIIFHLSNAIIRLVDKEDTLAKIWKKLDELFQQKSLAIYFLKKDYLSSRYQKGVSNGNES